VDNVIEAGQRRSSRPQVPQSVQMVRDPVCGTFVLPERAVALTDGRSSVYFCSAACRDQYRAGPSAGPGRPQSAPGRTA
jgi:YHS domain-containing protein